MQNVKKLNKKFIKPKNFIQSKNFKQLDVTIIEDPSGNDTVIVNYIFEDDGTTDDGFTMDGWTDKANLRTIDFGNIPLSREGRQFNASPDFTIENLSQPTILTNTSLAEAFAEQAPDVIISEIKEINSVLFKKLDG